MAGDPPRLGECPDARLLVSAALDGELSAVEAARLDRHLAGCAGCRDFAAAIGSSAALLRAAPLEQPRRRFSAPQRTVSFPVGRRLAVAAVAAAAALGSLIGSSLRAPAPPEAPAPQLSFLSRDVDQLRDLPREAPAPPPPPPRTNPPQGVV